MSIFFLGMVVSCFQIIPKMLQAMSGLNVFEFFLGVTLISSAFFIAPFALVDFFINKFPFLTMAKKLGVKPKKLLEISDSKDFENIQSRVFNRQKLMNEYWNNEDGYKKSRTVEQEIFDNNFEKQFEDLGIDLNSIPNAFNYEMKDGKIVRTLNRDAIQKVFNSLDDNDLINNQQNKEKSIISQPKTKMISRVKKSSKASKDIETGKELSNNL